MNTNKFEDYILNVIDRASITNESKRRYKDELMTYLAKGNSLNDPNEIIEYMHGLSKSSVLFFRAAINLLSNDIKKVIIDGNAPINLMTVQASIYRLEALGDEFPKRVRKKKNHIWLNKEQVKDIMHSCGEDLVGKRDWIILALLVGAGLRPLESVNINFNALIEFPRRFKTDKKLAALEVNVKGAWERTVPINQIMADRILELRWIQNTLRWLGPTPILTQFVTIRALMN